jgi:hypothetical protein
MDIFTSGRKGFTSGSQRCLLLSGARIARRFHGFAPLPPTSFHSAAVLTILAPITAAFAAITAAFATITAAFATITTALATITTAIAAVTTFSPEVSSEGLIVLFLHCSLPNPDMNQAFWRIWIRIQAFGDQLRNLQSKYF